VDQAIDFDAVNNHGVAIATSLSSDRRPLLVMASLPIQVIHGTEDPILPYAHGIASTETILDAELLTSENAGYEIPTCFENQIVERILHPQSH